MTRQTPHAPSVLVVAHDDMIREAVIDTLAAVGLDTTAVRHGRDVVPAVQRDRTIDLLLCEMDLPDLDGITLAQLVARIRPDLKVVLLVDGVDKLRLAARFGLYGLRTPSRSTAWAAFMQDVLWRSCLRT